VFDRWTGSDPRAVFYESRPCRLGIAVAEIVLISIGFIFLVDATIVIWEYQRDRQPEEHEHAGLLSRFLKYVQLSPVFLSIKSRGNP
jgi:hypothetical protein